MSHLTFYCPHCWQIIREGIAHCPYCGYELASFNALSYEDKLLRALWHPVAERRMMAIRLLGALRSQKALPDFARMISDEDVADYFLLREVLLAVEQIGGETAYSILQTATHHPSPLVRRLAEEMFEKTKKG